MLRRILLSVAAALLLCVQTPNAWAGAWTLPRHHWYGEYFYRYFGAKKSFDAYRHSSRKAKHAIFQDLRNEWKLEYGLTDWLNVLASAPYQSSHYRDDNVDLLTAGVGDIFVRTKLRMTEDPVVSAVQFSWKIPSAYNPNESPALGDGQVDFESRVLLSRSWVFSPYQVTVRKSPPSTRRMPTRPRVTAPSRAAAQALSASSKVKNRDEAMRNAMLVSELYERGRRFAEEGNPREAAKWLHAVLVTAPPHEEAQRILDQLMPNTDAAMMSPVRLTAESLQHPEEPAGEDVAMPAVETETRYARLVYVNVEGAFNARNEDPANEFPLYAEAGFTPWKRVMLVGSLENVVSVRSTHEQKEDFMKLGIRAIVNVWGDGFPSIFRRVQRNQPSVNVEVGYDGIVNGRNTDEAIEVFGKVGVFF